MVKTSPSSAGGSGSIPDWQAKIPCALRPKSRNIKQRQYCNKFNKDYKYGPHQRKKKKEKKIAENLIPSLTLLPGCLLLSGFFSFSLFTALLPSV